MVKRVCKYCKKNYSPHPRARISFYCSKSCGGKAWKENNLERWKEINKKKTLKYYNKCPENRRKLYLKSQPIFRKTTNIEKCERCSISQEEHFKKVGRSLSIHHKDKDRNNNDKENLEVLCSSCHGTLHDYMRNNKMGLKTTNCDGMYCFMCEHDKECNPEDA